MPPYTLPFEKPIQDQEKKLEELRAFSQAQNIDVSLDIERMENRITEMRREVYQNLGAWEKVLVARHPQRPYMLDYLAAMTEDFTELHGDRVHGDDRAILGGFAWLDGRRVMCIGTQKGRDTKTNLDRNFGCAYPEGYRKALRLMRLAAKFKTPIITLIDTPGAYPGIESEERHIAEAIAVNLREMFRLPVPIVVTVIGEGGSGGALGIGVGDRVLILEYSYYSVISPEGCAAILWKNRSQAPRAAEALQLTAPELLKAKLVDEVLPEPPGGAHADPAAMTATLREALIRNLADLEKVPVDELLQRRYDKFRAMGVFGSDEKAPELPSSVAE